MANAVAGMVARDHDRPNAGQNNTVAPPLGLLPAADLSSLPGQGILDRILFPLRFPVTGF